MSFPVGISSRGIFSVVFLSAFVFLLTGCTLATTAPDAPLAGTALQGKVYGGNQPVVGAHVYLMKTLRFPSVGSAGYGLASTSLLSCDDGTFRFRRSLRTHRLNGQLSARRGPGQLNFVVSTTRTEPPIN